MSSDAGGGTPVSQPQFSPIAQSAKSNETTTQVNPIEERNRVVLESIKKSKREELLSDPTIDIVSKDMLSKRIDELQLGRNLRVQVRELENIAKQAKAGKGIYAVNRKNAEMIRQSQEKPGRQQTILSQGAKELSGTESMGILTGLNK